MFNILFSKADPDVNLLVHFNEYFVFLYMNILAPNVGNLNCLQSFFLQTS